MQTMSSIISAISNPLSFDKQIPVTDINAMDFREAIKDNQILCSINGVRVNNINTKAVNIDVSFKILEDLDIMTPGTSITGKTIYKTCLDAEDITNVNGSNVTLNFDVNKYDAKGLIEVNNTHELYNIFSIALKSKGLMDKAETGSIIVKYNRINDYLKDIELYLTTIPVSTKRGLEVNAIPGDETQ